MYVESENVGTFCGLIRLSILHPRISNLPTYLLPTSNGITTIVCLFGFQVCMKNRSHRHVC